MNDLISRKAAINAICEDGTWLERQGCTEITMVERKQRDVDILEDLPSTQPVAKDINVLSNDLIIRQAAIDQLHQSYNLLDAERRLEDMPAAQPESCEDAVSRDDVLCNIDKLVNQSDDGLLEPEDVIVSVSYLPSVTPKQRSFSCGQENDLISRQAAIDALGERPMVWTDDDEYALGERNQYDIDRLAIEAVPSAQRTCVNCGRTANNGGWYADGRTRCPIEEHYALPKDGYCHLWEKRNVTDDDYPERREE